MKRWNVSGKTRSALLIRETVSNSCLLAQGLMAKAVKWKPGAGLEKDSSL